MSWFTEKVVPFLKEGVNVEAIGAEFESEVQRMALEQIPGVIDNKEKILNEKKELQKAYNDMKEKYSSFEDGEITFEMFSQIQSDYEALKASSGGGELTDDVKREQYEMGKKASLDLLNPKLKSFEEKNLELQKALEQANGKYLDFRARNEVRRAIDEANIDIDDYWFEGFMSKSEVSYNSENDALEINVPYGEGKTPLSDWKNVYPQTDEGKKRVKAPLNYGGGANGGRGSNGGRMTLDEIAKLPSRAERNKAYEDNGFDV